MTLAYRTVTELFDDGSGTAMAGTGTFTASAVVYNGAIPVVTPGSPIQASIVEGLLKNAAGGALQLLPNDTAGLEVEGQTAFWFWTVALTVNGSDLDQWSFILPTGDLSPVELFSLSGGIGGGGGFTDPMTTVGDMIAEGAGPAPARVAGNTSATREFLISQGTGSAAQVPAFGALQKADLGTVPASPAQYAPLLYGGVWGWPWEFWIDAYGAAAATFVPDAVTTASSAVCTSASGGFAGAVAGQPILVAGAGATIGTSAQTLVTTILSVQSATHITLSVNAASTTTSPNGAVWGPGCGVAIKAALAAATTYMGSNSGRKARIITPPGWFMTETPAVTGTPAFANAQVPLPLGGLNTPYYPEFTGLGGATPIAYFGSGLPAQGGSAWVCARSDGTPGFTSTNGYSSVLGGPTTQQGYGPSGSPLFSNTKPVLDGLSFILPSNSTYCGWDFSCCAKANPEKSSTLAFASVAQMPYPSYAANLSTPFTFGGCMPFVDNNDDCSIGDYACEGIGWGLVPSEHTAHHGSMRLVYCYNALTPWAGSSGVMPHSIALDKVSAEACINAVNMGLATGQTVIDIAQLDTENINNDHVADSGNVGYGVINIRSYAQSLLKTGASNLTINFIET